MRRNRWLAVAALVVIGSGLMIIPGAPRTTAAPASDPEQASFRGKVLLVRAGFGMETHILEQVRVRQFGTQSFLLGKVVESLGSRDALKGKSLWLNLSGITQMIECEDSAAAKKLLKSLPQMGGYGAAAIFDGPLPATTPAPLPPVAAPATSPAEAPPAPAPAAPPPTPPR